MSQYLADIKETEFFIMDEEAHHVCTVARCKEGEEITVFNGKGLQYTGRIERIQKNFVRGSLLKKVPLRRPAVELELFFAPNSRTGLEEVLDKGTQLGVAAFCPIVTARTEYDVLKRWEDKFPRWRQIMLSACKQCNTPLFPEIYEPVTFLHAVQDKIPSLITYEAEETHTVSWGLEKLCAPKRLRVYVGPAGGWTDEEIVIAAQYGILPITLGVNILRAETACIAAAAKIL